jgi:hypothetical protein
MMELLSQSDKKQLEGIKRELTVTGAKESSFVKIELLFYQAISVARQYGDNEDENGLLAALKKIQVSEYQDTKAYFKKNTQREKVIRRFISSIKNALSTAVKNGFAQPQYA